ncbi:MAG TPA: DUF2059 domain-containing protein [Roseimicrobium sp.]|nr:DUF2059 domain-containing protein [Roseimicrobium sp.]
MKLHLALILLVALAVNAIALEDSPENRSKEADRYLAATPPKDMLNDMAEQVAQNLPPEQQDAFRKTLTQNLDMVAVTSGIKTSMVKHFTADELKGLADFYGSEVGKSATKKFGAYLADAMPVMQAEMIKAMAKSRKEAASPAAAPAPAPTAAPATAPAPAK